MKTHTFNVHAGHTLDDSFVELDGQRLAGVTGFSFSVTADAMMRVRLDIMGEVFVSGKFEPRELAQIHRDVPHPGTLRVRLRRAFKQLFLGTPDDVIDGLTNTVVSGLESEKEVA